MSVTQVEKGGRVKLAYRLDARPVAPDQYHFAGSATVRSGLSLTGSALDGGEHRR
jgi:hypothetical protein